MHVKQSGGDSPALGWADGAKELVWGQLHGENQVRRDWKRGDENE
jgi:hypothetical protein